jgi:serine/threonine-protein kinase
MSTPLDWQTRPGGRRSRPNPPVSLASVNVYELLEELGRGRTGVVYKARQVGLKRVVALKVMRDALFAGRREKARFRREAEAVARLHHPNVVQVHDCGEHNDVPFFCMEYVDGGTLARRLAAGPLTVEEAVALIEVLARAVHYAHTQGIVHRDLKPSNVLLGSDGTPKVADFSIAKHLNGKNNDTESWAILGTPAYMAPEQAWGRSRRVTPAADTYALGVLLYEALAGRPPFRGETSLETLLQVRSQTPLPPSAWRPCVPEALDAACLKCLEKEPGRRYRTSLALADELRRLRDANGLATRGA